MLTRTFFLVVACHTLQKSCFKKRTTLPVGRSHENRSQGAWRCATTSGLHMEGATGCWGFFEPGEGATVQCQVTNLKLTAQAPLKNGDPPTWFWRNSYWQPPFLGANCLFQGGYVLFFWGGRHFEQGFVKGWSAFRWRALKNFTRISFWMSGTESWMSQIKVPSRKLIYHIPLKSHFWVDDFPNFPKKRVGPMFSRSEWRVSFVFSMAYFHSHLLQEVDAGICTMTMRLGELVDWWVFSAPEMGRKWLVSCSSKEMSEASCSMFVCLDIRGLPQACCYLYFKWICWNQRFIVVKTFWEDQGWIIIDLLRQGWIQSRPTYCWWLIYIYHLVYITYITPCK